MIVPKDNVVQLQQPAEAQIEPKYLMMAAALMHEEGRLQPQAGKSGQTNNELYEDIRTQSKKHEQGVRMNPNDPTFKEFEKNLPPDLEIIDSDPDTGRGKGESLRVRAKKAPLTS